MEPLTVIAKHMTGICDVAELCVCALTNGGFLDDVWTLQKFDYNPPHSALLTVRGYLSHFNTSVTCMLFLWLLSVSFSSALQALPCDIGIATLEMRNTWSWAVNPLGLGSYLCSKDVCVWGGFKCGFVLALVNLTRSLPEPRVMFSLKSASMASFPSSSVLPLSRCFSSVSHPIIWIWVQIHQSFYSLKLLPCVIPAMMICFLHWTPVCLL